MEFTPDRELTRLHSIISCIILCDGIYSRQGIDTVVSQKCSSALLDGIYSRQGIDTHVYPVYIHISLMEFTPDRELTPSICFCATRTAFDGIYSRQGIDTTSLAIYTVSPEMEFTPDRELTHFL